MKIMGHREILYLTSTIFRIKRKHYKCLLVLKKYQTRVSLEIIFKVYKIKKNQEVIKGRKDKKELADDIY